ncbi:2Fe-2S iron-sulfur cluster-binding protein [Methylobacterium nigriterrae]|uniref:2Fe-2S iron-sulfur cluster-binding protein n=1 Tax=Methylobacterium nigriterrae TaxID=3127512 RepID=UPI0030135A5E
MTTTSSINSGPVVSQFEPLPRSETDALDDESRRWHVEVQSKSGTLAFTCETNENLLYAGLRQGLTLPYECATGTCGTCRARVASGSVAVGWEAAPGHKGLKRDKGDILMCQTRPQSDCVLRVPAHVHTSPRHAVPRHHSAVIDSVRQLTRDVIHFEIALNDSISFDAGQFVVLRAPHLEGMRAYSMVNFATETCRLELVIKRKPGGGFGNWIFDAAREGQTVDVFGPLGRATFHPEENYDLLMIAGGSGIAGMMSILSRAAQEGYFGSHKGYVFFGVRTLADGFYLADFSEHVAAANGNLEITLAISDEAVTSPVHPDHPHVRLAEGFVHEVCARAMKGRYDNVMSYIAGPPPMVDGALRSLIVEGRMTPDRIRYDKFG